MTTLKEIATGDSSFSILVAALQNLDTNAGTDFVTTLDTAGANLTVFAPTNAAFGQLAVDLGFAGDPADVSAVGAFLLDTNNVATSTLKAVVEYHVSVGIQSAADIAAAGSVATLGGGTIGADLPTLVDNEPDLIDPSVVAANIAASNGIVHVIDRVLIPVDLPDNDAPTITGIVAASGAGFDANPADFDLLLKAVTTAGLAGLLNDESLDVTVFAPNDGAFVGLSQTLGFSGSDESGAWDYLVEALTLLGGGDPIPLLDSVLKYHVATESLQASQVLGADSIATVQGGALKVEGAMLVDADPDLADPSIIATDIQAANGVVHVIDGVLLPADLLKSNGAKDVDFIIADDADNKISTGADNDLVDGNGGNDKIFTGWGNDVVLAGDGHDIVFAGIGMDLISGGDGNDRVWAGWGKDTVSGGDGNDVIVGFAGDDQLHGNDGDDRLIGNWGDDVLKGGDGHDRLFAGKGDDTLEGGEGDDLLSGGWGNDVFVFNEEDGNDSVLGFRQGMDKIDVSSFGFAGFDEIEHFVDRTFGGISMDLGEGTHVFLAGVNRMLTEDDFIF